MNFIKRAYQYLWAKKGKSVLMIAILSVIMIFVLAGLSIYQAANQAITNAQKSTGATVTLTQNREAMFQAKEKEEDNDQTSSSSEQSQRKTFSRTPINLSDAKKIAALSGVKSYLYTATTSVDAASGIEAIESSAETSSTSETTSGSNEATSESKDNEVTSGASQSKQGNGQMPPGEAMSQGDFRVQGVSDSSLLTTFTQGEAKIIKGSAITSADEGSNAVLIEKTLAEDNDLSVGDTFKVITSDDKEVELKVKGIYETTDAGDELGMQFNFLNPANTLITSYTMVATLKGGDSETIDEATFTLEDPAKMDSFIKQAEELIDTDTFSLQSNDQMYQQMLQPLNNVKGFAKNIIILVGVAGVVILTLIVMLSLKDRRYEMGVLLSLGESRIKLIGQFFIEIIICLVFALGIAGVTGNLVGNALGNQLISQQTTSTQNQQTNNQPGGAPGKVQNGQTPPSRPGGNRQNPFAASQEVKNLKINVQPKQFMLLTAIAIGIVLIAICFASIGIFRLNPKSILIS